MLRNSLCFIIVIVFLSCSSEEKAEKRGIEQIFNNKSNISNVQTNTNIKYVWDTIATVTKIRPLNDTMFRLNYEYVFRNKKFQKEEILDTMWLNDYRVNKKYSVQIDEFDFSDSQILPYEERE